MLFLNRFAGEVGLELDAVLSELIMINPDAPARVSSLSASFWLTRSWKSQGNSPQFHGSWIRPVEGHEHHPMVDPYGGVPG